MHLKRVHTVAVLLLIELVDELVGSGMDAAWPLVRDELGLSYAQIGLCMGLPAVLAGLADPVTSILGDVGRRRLVVLLGGLAFAGALVLRGASPSFPLLLASLVLFYPASGAFVNLSQASLMDLDPARRELNMARWTLFGSTGMVAGPLLLAATIWLGGSWRHLFLAAAGVSLLVALWQWRAVVPHENEPVSLRRVWGAAVGALRARGAVRWLVLIQAGDLMLDVFMAFLALYLVEVGRVSPAQAALAVSVWTGVGLVGDLLLISLLHRVKGLAYLRFSAGVVLVLFPLFLLVPWFSLKLVFLGLLGLLNSGWYAILQAQVYATLPGRSGTALALFNLSCLGGALLPIALGVAAQTFGLAASFWLLWLGPLALVIGIRHRHIAAAASPGASRPPS
jgi:FSR family fosmidomycin resistance protein-like MFS transporter